MFIRTENGWALLSSVHWNVRCDQLGNVFKLECKKKRLVWHVCIYIFCWVMYDPYNWLFGPFRKATQRPESWAHSQKTNLSRCVYTLAQSFSLSCVSYRVENFWFERVSSFGNMPTLRRRIAQFKLMPYIALPLAPLVEFQVCVGFSQYSYTNSKSDFRHTTNISRSHLI